MADLIPDKNDIQGDLGGRNVLKEFQLSGNTQSKLDKDFGKKIMIQCERIINSGYFSDRNIRFALNRAMANGRMDIKKFMDFFNFDGKTDYVNIAWKSIMIVNTIISRLVGRWMTKKQKASVTAVDDVSIKEKTEKYNDAEFYMANKDMLQDVGQQAGVQLIPQDQFIPEDKDQLDSWAQDELRIPEEILYEVGIDTVFEENGWGNMGVNTRKQKHDAAEVGLIGKETIADKNGKIIVNYCKPENMFYSYSEYPDFRDADIKGEIVSYKMTQIREMYPKLEVKELYEIAKSSKDWQNTDKITFDTTMYNRGMFLPFDDWNVDVVRATFCTLDVDRSLIKVATDGSMYVDKPKKKIEDLYPGNEYVEKTIWNVYRLVYVRQPQIILEWGLEKNMIRPQNYDKIGYAYSPYSFYMYQNKDMRNLAIPEKIEEPVEQMILARLKIQQLVAKMRPSGLKYDIRGLRGMDLGNGIMTPLQLMKVTDQTGNVYYDSKDDEGNNLNNPIEEVANAGSVPQMQQLIELYNYHSQVVRDEIGINEFSEGQTIKPRTGQQNVQTALEISFNATDYINDACIANDDEASGKIACLLHDAVEFGSKEYRHLMGEADVKGRDFHTKIEMLPTLDEINELDATLQNAMNAQPDLVLFLNPEKVKRIAKKNVKLAENYYRQGLKRAIEGRAKQAQQQSEMNAQAQQQSAIVAEQAKQKSMEMELQLKGQLEMGLSQARQKETILTGIFAIYSKGLPIPPELKGLETEIIQNVALPLFAENMANEQAINDAAQQQENEQQEGQQPPQDQSQGQMQQPPEGMVQ